MNFVARTVSFSTPNRKGATTQTCRRVTMNHLNQRQSSAPSPLRLLLQRQRPNPKQPVNRPQQPNKLPLRHLPLSLIRPQRIVHWICAPTATAITFLKIPTAKNITFVRSLVFPLDVCTNISAPKSLDSTSKLENVNALSVLKIKTCLHLYHSNTVCFMQKLDYFLGESISNPNLIFVQTVVFCLYLTSYATSFKDFLLKFQYRY